MRKNLLEALIAWISAQPIIVHDRSWFFEEVEIARYRRKCGTIESLVLE